MRRTLLTLVLLALPGLASADTQLVVLKSGAEVYGTVKHRGDTVEVTSVGGHITRYKLSDIKSIEGLSAPRPTAAKAPPAQVPPGVTIESIQQRIMSDPEMMAALMQIAEDPALLQSLLTPEMLGAIRTGNLDAASRDPATQRAAADPRIQAIMKKLAAELEQPVPRGR